MVQSQVPGSHTSRSDWEEMLPRRTETLIYPSHCVYGRCSDFGDHLVCLTAITQLVHHGMIFVPIGYTFGAGMFEIEKVRGGSPYGAGTYDRDGSRQPSELEFDLAFH
ncbi:hypothetical protein SO802_030013 [Lithocarpus litseifolius]|uniref:Uncharacterized protein n=1 Tax=Lithocarpus litseifolius TaxID=425828 RepID=A0AAW2BY38_9ROSI